MKTAVSFGVLLSTNVVGSYPVVRGHGIRSIFDPLSFAVKTAVEEQITAGIDIIPDDQVRWDQGPPVHEQPPGDLGPGSDWKNAPRRNDHYHGRYEVCTRQESIFQGYRHRSDHACPSTPPLFG